MASTAAAQRTQSTRRPSSLDRAVAAAKMPALYPSGRCYVIESATHPEFDYVLTINGDQMLCTCEGRRHPDCKHRAALRYCLAHGVMGVYTLCANCGTTRVPKVGGWCSGCANLWAMVAEQEMPAEMPTSILPFPSSDPVHARHLALTATRLESAGVDPLACLFG